MIALVPLLVLIGGLMLHAFVAHATVKEFGRACVWIGLFWLVSGWAGRAVTLFAS